MYEIKKRIEICSAHKLKLDYPSKCSNMHGHNWKIDVFLRSEKLNENGMIIDFDHIAQKLIDKLDHKILNDVLDFNPTAENLAKFVCDFFAPYCYKVIIEECEGNMASYSK
ncbi:MAG: 6-carboxytetrahydropterin synthase QueD [Firmicutes bacterium]|nr:6-carboxytetrahydropterin synthase QueD [Bacillota bacterium]